MHRFANTVRLYRSSTRLSYYFYARSIRFSQCQNYSTPSVLKDPAVRGTTATVKGDNAPKRTVTVFNAPRPESAGPMILYIERGLHLDNENSRIDRDIPPKDLASAANATVFRVECVASKDSPYPVAVHQVLRSYDWVFKTFATSETTIGSQKPRPRIGVCGELIGGSLAAMLALTESHTMKQGISAAAIGNPVLDWTALFAPEMSKELRSNDQPACPPKTQNIHERPAEILNSLLAMRQDIFPKAERYHDPFASPLLFFRTPSSELPLDTVRLDSGEDKATEDPLPETIRKRRSLRKYPPTHSDLVLPHMRVELGEENILKDQGIELIDLMRRSHARSEVELAGSRDSAPQRSFNVVERQGLGWWSEKDFQRIGHWFGEVLRKPD